jgi:hypothetical protein
LANPLLLHVKLCVLQSHPPRGSNIIQLAHKILPRVNKTAINGIISARNVAKTNKMHKTESFLWSAKLTLTQLAWRM